MDKIKYKLLNTSNLAKIINHNVLPYFDLILNPSAAAGAPLRRRTFWKEELSIIHVLLLVIAGCRWITPPNIHDL
jgi:hypothetical protein